MLVNHKPDLASNLAETRITPSPSLEMNRYNLAMKADDSGGTYLYSGTQQPSESYALLFNPISQSFTLDRVSTDFTFNLRSTPTIKSSKALASTYPHLYTGVSDPESSSDELLEENDLDTSGADPNNPYDYRHFLKRRRASSSVTPELPALTPVFPPRRTAPRPKQAPRSARPPPKRAPSPPPREEADADNEESDDGGLTIEFDPDTKPSRFKNAFSYDTRNGPISLRSAASSVSPAAMGEAESSESDEDEDVEEMQLEVNGVGIMPAPDEEPEEDEEDDDEDDHHNDDEEDHQNDDEEDDDDGSLEAELEQALGAQAGEEINGAMQGMVNGVVTGTGHGLGIAGVGSAVRMNNNPILDESSSESEEE